MALSSVSSSGGMSSGIDAVTLSSLFSLSPIWT